MQRTESTYQEKILSVDFMQSKREWSNMVNSQRDHANILNPEIKKPPINMLTSRSANNLHKLLPKQQFTNDQYSKIVSPIQKQTIAQVTSLLQEPSSVRDMHKDKSKHNCNQISSNKLQQRNKLETTDKLFETVSSEEKQSFNGKITNIKSNYISKTPNPNIVSSVQLKDCVKSNKFSLKHLKL